MKKSSLLNFFGGDPMRAQADATAVKRPQLPATPKKKVDEFALRFEGDRQNKPPDYQLQEDLAQADKNLGLRRSERL